MAKQSIRKCVACRVSEPKKVLLRFVVRDGRLEFDHSSQDISSEQGYVKKRVRSLNGRGAYLHKNEECLKRALNTKLWKYALKKKDIVDIQLALESALLR